jgi:hypothetical protein
MRWAIGWVLACVFGVSAAWAEEFSGKWTTTAVGNTISVHVVRTTNNADNKIQWQRTIHGEEIRFTHSVEGTPGPAMEIVAKRSK